MHGGVPAEAVVGVVEAGLQGGALLLRQTPVQQGRGRAGEDVEEGGVDRSARGGVGVRDLPHLHPWRRNRGDMVMSTSDRESC